MSRPVPATVRTRVRLPLCLHHGLVTEAMVFSFDGLVDGREHLAIGLGDRSSGGPHSATRRPLVRLHSECLTGDVLGSQRCDCGPQLREGLTRISEAGGYLLYLRQEGRGIGLYNKLDAYELQETGLDTYQANVALGFGVDERDYTVAAQMLLGLGVEEMDLLTNNPDKVAQMESAGLRVRTRMSTGVHLSPVNQGYLEAKGLNGHRLFDLAD